MPREIKIKSIRNQLPTRYCHPQVLRFLMIGIALLVLAYSLYFVIRYVNSDTANFFKLLPLFIMFICLDSLFRQTTSLNCITFFPERLKFSYILKKPLEIPYSAIMELKLHRRITYYLHISYRDEQGSEKLFSTPASFPKILEIIVNIAELAPQARLTDLLSKAVQHLKTQTEIEDEQQV